MNKILIFLALISALSSASQNSLYNPEANTGKEIKEAIAKAKLENRHVLIQVGGNWCPWCHKLHKFIAETDTLSSIIARNYVVVKLNYSKENKNLDLLKSLDNPQRFGFPVIVILNENGVRIHTQDTGLLESGDGYDLNKVLRFLKLWTFEACHGVK